MGVIVDSTSDNYGIIQSTKIEIGKLSGHVSKRVLLLENKNVWFPDEGG